MRGRNTETDVPTPLCACNLETICDTYRLLDRTGAEADPEASSDIFPAVACISFAFPLPVRLCIERKGWQLASEM